MTASTPRLALLGAALLLGAVLAYLITRSIRGGVRSVIDRLTSLTRHDTTELREGLEAMADGDLTRELSPYTVAIERWTNDEIGDVAQAVNGVRENTERSLDAYNATRAALADMIGEITSVAGTVASSTQQVASTSEEAGRAVSEIAHAVTDVASGAERQVRMVDDARVSAQETAASADRARSVAEEGGRASQEATAARSPTRSAGSHSRRTCWRSMPPSRPPGRAIRVAASPWSPKRCASSRRRASGLPARSPA
jgi:methyl-accepting chemotaxis protein